MGFGCCLLSHRVPTSHLLFCGLYWAPCISSCLPCLGAPYLWAESPPTEDHGPPAFSFLHLSRKPSLPSLCRPVIASVFHIYFSFPAQGSLFTLSVEASFVLLLKSMNRSLSVFFDISLLLFFLPLYYFVVSVNLPTILILGPLPGICPELPSRAFPPFPPSCCWTKNALAPWPGPQPEPPPGLSVFLLLCRSCRKLGFSSPDTADSSSGRRPVDRARMW